MDYTHFRCIFAHFHHHFADHSHMTPVFPTFLQYHTLTQMFQPLCRFLYHFGDFPATSGMFQPLRGFSATSVVFQLLHRFSSHLADFSATWVIFSHFGDFQPLEWFSATLDIFQPLRGFFSDFGDFQHLHRLSSHFADCSAVWQLFSHLPDYSTTSETFQLLRWLHFIVNFLPQLHVLSLPLHRLCLHITDFVDVHSISMVHTDSSWLLWGVYPPSLHPAFLFHFHIPFVINVPTI